MNVHELIELLRSVEDEFGPDTQVLIYSSATDEKLPVEGLFSSPESVTLHGNEK